MELFIRADGSAQCLYDEKIKLDELGSLDIKRASHVEPDPQSPGYWFVDLSPVGGPCSFGYKTRAAALAAEAKWLNEKMRDTHIVATP